MGESLTLDSIQIIPPPPPINLQVVVGGTRWTSARTAVSCQSLILSTQVPTDSRTTHSTLHEMDSSSYCLSDCAGRGPERADSGDYKAALQRSEVS